MIIIRDIKVKLNNDLNYQKNALIKKSASLLRVRPDKIKDLQIIKRSIDARKKPEIFYNYQVVVSVEDEDRILKAKRNNKIDRDFAPGETIKIIRKDQAAIAKYFEELAGVKVQRNV